MAKADFEGAYPLPAAAGLESSWAVPSSGLSRRPRFLGGLRRASDRAFDVVGASALALIFAPLMFFIVLFVRGSGGPAFFPHERVGLHGRSFRCYKFRTMVPNADLHLARLLDANAELMAEWQGVRKLRDDPRITPIGRFLRRTSLDELPQLWNVIRGDMSLVGPRPIVREELAMYGRNLGTYLGQRPGLTGLWQVMGRSDTAYDRRVAMDVYYARNRSFLLNLLILAKTVRVVLRGNGAY